MPTPCKNHPEKASYAHGLCQSCYMKARRAKSKSYVGRWPTGYNVNWVVTIGGFEDALLLHIDTSGGPDACHPWTHTKNAGGYGMFTKYGHTVLAHRLRFAMDHPDSIHAPVIMHICDNPQCCNPSHLRAGSYAENMQDMHAKGRRRPSPADHLRDRNNHPRAKPVTTPHGDFPSAALAAEACGWNVRRVCSYCQRSKDGWSYR